MKRKLDTQELYEKSYKRNLTINTDINYLPCDLCGNLTSLFRIMCTTPYVACSDDCLAVLLLREKNNNNLVN